RRSLPPFLVYAVLIALVTPPVVAWYIRLAFYAFAFLVFSVVWPSDAKLTSASGAPSRSQRRVFLGVLIVAGLALVVSRLLPFFRYGNTPLGYDTGFYLSSMQASTHGILTGIGHRNIRALIWLPLSWLGISPIAYLHGLYVLTQFLIAGMVYAYARTMRATHVFAYGATALFLFAVSIPQFFAYWWMYYQTELAIAFLLTALILLRRRSFLAFIVGAFGAAIHPATFLPLIVALATFLAIQLLRSLVRLRPLDPGTRFLLLGSVITVLATVPFTERIAVFVRTYLRATAFTYGWFIADYPIQFQAQLSGLYVPLPVVHLAGVYLLPFALASVVRFAWRRWSRDAQANAQFLFLLVYGVVLLILVIAGVIYANRYLIYLDLALMLLAVPSVVRFVRVSLRDRSGYALAVLLGVGLLIHGGTVVAKQEPHLTESERQEIIALTVIAEQGAYAMSTISHYTPWVNAFSGRATIDPGYLSANRWDYAKWQEFWSGKSDARRHELLRMYHRPIYVFMGIHALEDQLPYIRFIQTDPYFSQMSPHVWRYVPGAISDAEIAAMREAERAR
ncbi:hypothetical protein HY480_00130, partial [Candidatus Uhrbacteria bacterium]|nr:hypothetical protein [Candidatus Uhrbacteria bacterium]